MAKQISVFSDYSNFIYLLYFIVTKQLSYHRKIKNLP